MTILEKTKETIDRLEGKIMGKYEKGKCPYAAITDEVLDLLRFYYKFHSSIKNIIDQDGEVLFYREDGSK